MTLKLTKFTNITALIKNLKKTKKTNKTHGKATVLIKINKSKKSPFKVAEKIGGKAWVLKIY